MFNALSKLSRCGRITGIYAKRLTRPAVGYRHISQGRYVQGPFRNTLAAANEESKGEKMNAVISKLQEITGNVNLDPSIIPEGGSQFRGSFAPNARENAIEPETQNTEAKRIMEKIVNTFIDYANNSENDYSHQPDFIDDFFLKSRAPSSTLGREVYAIPEPPVTEDINENAIAEINGYIGLICSGTAHGSAGIQIVRKVESYLFRDDIASKISRDALNSYLSHLRRVGDFSSIRRFINTLMKKTVLANDVLPYNYLFFTLSSNRRIKRLSSVEMAYDALASMVSRRIPVKFSTWQCIYQIVGYAPGRKLLDVMLENKFPLQKMFYKILGNNRYLYETCDDFLDFINEHKDVFGELSPDQYMQIYAFYDEMDLAEKLLKKQIRSRELDIAQLKTLVHRFCFNNEIYNVIALIQICSWACLNLNQGIRRELYKYMLLSYARHCNYYGASKEEKEFLVLFFRYLYQRSHHGKAVRSAISENTSPEFFNAVSQSASRDSAQKEVDEKFANEINSTLKWTSDNISFKLENNDEPFQKLVTTFIYPELGKVRNDGEAQKEVTEEAEE